MKNKIVFYSLLLPLFCFHTKLVAQFDDVYYDPDAFEYKEESILPVETEQEERTNETTERTNETTVQEEWDDEDYEYSSRIRRFHRPYRDFDYYDPCYVDVYYYDPFAYDPWFWDRDIYYSHNRYNDYYRWRRWNGVYRPYRYTYWNNWDWSYGFGGYCSGYNYGYNPYYSYGYNPYHYYNPHWGNGYSSDNDNDGNYNSNRGSYYGSRKHGLVVTSKNGPSRIYKPQIPPKIVVAGDSETLNTSPRNENKPRLGNNPTRMESNPGEKSDQNPGRVIRPNRDVRVEPHKDVKPEIIPDGKNEKTNTTPPVRIRKEDPGVKPDIIPHKRIERVERDSRPTRDNKPKVETEVPETKPKIIRKENYDNRPRRNDDIPREIKRIERQESPRENNVPHREIKTYDAPRNSSSGHSNPSKNDAKSNDSGSGRRSPR